MVALDADGGPVRDALLWNDTRAAPRGRGPRRRARRRAGLCRGDRERARRVVHERPSCGGCATTSLTRCGPGGPGAAPARLCLRAPRRAGDAGLHRPRRRLRHRLLRRAASGVWRHDLLAAALGHDAELPAVVAPGAVAGTTRSGAVLAPGTGDNMGAALGLDLTPADVLVLDRHVRRRVHGRRRAGRRRQRHGHRLRRRAAAASCRWSTTMNAAGILDLQARLLGVDHDELAALALACAARRGRGDPVAVLRRGAHARTGPHAVGTWTGLTPAHHPRGPRPRGVRGAAVFARRRGRRPRPAHRPASHERVLLVGGAARNPAVRALAPAILGRPCAAPAAGEYVALGAARQAAWALSGAAEPPTWPRRRTPTARGTTRPPTYASATPSCATAPDLDLTPRDHR